MLRWVDWEDDWSAFRLVLPVAAAVIALASLLVFVWSFDPAISPIWQVALHHLMLALFMSTTFVLAAQPRSFLGEGFRRAMLVLAIGLPVVVFSASWVMNGAYEGVRDERFFGIVIVSTMSFVFLCGVSALIRVVFVFVRELFQERPQTPPERPRTPLER